MKFSKKKVLALAGAIANLSFTCAVAGVATYAWFCLNDQVYANEMKIQASDPDIVINDYKILKYDDDMKKGVAYSNSTAQFFLPDYDEYIKARNVYSNVVIRVELMFARGLDTSSEAVEIDITKLATSTLKDANGIRQLISNVAQFKCITTSYTPYNSNTEVPVGVGIEEVAGEYQDANDAMYRTAIAYFATRKTPSTFISLMNGQPVDPESGNLITIIPELYNVGTVKRSVVYIECSYNEQLASGFVADHPDAPLHNLTGDIDKMDFVIRPFDSGEYGQRNTGKYLRMNDVGRSYDGKYLAGYPGDGYEAIIDGSKATGNETIGSSSGINTNNNKYAVGNYMANNKNSVYASDRIDDASLSFSKRNGTYQTENGYYIGNNTTTAGIISSSNSTGLTNSLEYSSDNAVVKSTVNTNMQMKYDTTNEKFAYYNNQNNDISLYRFHENKMIDATLTSLQVNGPTGSSAQFSVGEFFSLRGVSCIATYTRGNSTFTINVNSMCTYNTSPEGTLEPDLTTFTESNANKTINVSYSDRGITKTGSYTISVIEDVIEYMEITSPATHTTYIKGDTFDITGLEVTGTFTVNGQVDITSQCIFQINDVTYDSGATLNISGDNLYVYVIYSGNATRGPAYQDRRFTISIKEYVCQIDEENENILLNDSIGLSLTFNSTVIWEITGTSGAVSFSSSEVVTTHTTTYTGSNWANQTETVTVYGLAGGQCTVTAKIQGRESVKDTCIIRVIDGNNLVATYTIESKSSVSVTGLPPQYSTADFNSTYSGNKFQLTGGNSMTLTLHGYTGYKITGITMSMHSNGSAGSGSFSAVAGGTTISSIATTGFNNWYDGDYTTSFVEVSPTITVQKAIRQNQDVVITISATVNSLYCENFTIHYEAVTDATATSLTLYQPNTNEITNNQTINITSGSVGDTWVPTALVTYSDSSSNADVTWSKTGSGNITLNAQNGSIQFNETSGTVVITATTNVYDANDQAIVKSFTLHWEGFTRVLSSITVSGQTTSYAIDDTFSFDGTVTAHYNDNTEQTISAPNYTVDSSDVDMTTAGTYTVTVSYTENNVTKSVEYTITVSSGGGGNGTYAITFTKNANDSSSPLTTDNFLTSSAVDDNDLIGTITATSKCYAGKQGLKFGTGSANGSFTGTPVTDASTNVTAIKISSTAYGSDGGKLVLTVNGTAVNSNITPGGEYTYTPASPISVTNFSVATSSLRAYVDKVTFVVGNGGTPPTPTKTLDSIALSGTYKTSYKYGDEFDSTGIVVTATYDDLSTDDVTSDAVFSGYSSTTMGQQTITVSYTENEVTKTATYTITLGARTLVSIAVSNATTQFTVNDSFDFGGTVTATYDNNTHADVTQGATFSGYNMANTGQQTVTVSYTEGGVTETTTYTITVSPSGSHTEYFYQKVEATGELIDGGQYLIVCESENVAFDGSLATLDAVSDTIAVTIDTSGTKPEIASNNTTDASTFTIDLTNHTIQSASGYYIGQTSYSNGMQTNENTTYTNTVTIDNSGNAVITAEGGCTLRFNSASNQMRFRYYKSGQTAVQLYVRKSRIVND